MEEEKSDDGLAIRTHKNRRNDDSTAHAASLLQREGRKGGRSGESRFV